MIMMSLIIVLTTIAQVVNQRFVISGFVSNQISGEMLPGASLYSTETELGVITNAYGFYSITLPRGKHTLTCRFIGYESFKLVVYLDKDLRLNPQLTPQAIQLAGVEVTGTTETDRGCTRF
jgi:hypothetical protein